MTYDVIIIGCGITGACIARELSKYKLNICIVDKANDVACGSSKANSGIVHAGYDAMPGTLMAKLNVSGAGMYESLASQLHFDYKNIGSIVVGFSDEDMVHIKKLYDRGVKNGVQKLSIINQEELRRLEPNISDDAVGALLAESAGIVNPYEAVWAITENAVMNGVKLYLNSEVHKIEKKDDLFEVYTGRQSIPGKCIVNAAGLYADKISKMAGARNYKILPRRGEYYLLDNKCSALVSHTLFQVPDSMGKGILVTPTVDGNILSGPTATDSTEKNDTQTTSEGQNLVFMKSEKTIPSIPRRNIINSFAGVRAVALFEDGTPVKDFIIEEDSDVKRFINVGGVCSPGLTAAPAIGVYVSALVEKALKIKFQPDSDFINIRKGIESFKNATVERKIQLIEENPLYGKIICRCEMITEAEIVAAIRSPVGAADLDGVKRRTRSGMGRCQGGFCSPKVTEIISRELKIPMTSVTKNGGCSYILNSKIR